MRATHYENLFDACRASGLRLQLVHAACPTCKSLPGERNRCVQCRGAVPWLAKLVVRTRDDVTLSTETVDETGIQAAAERSIRRLRTNRRIP